MPPKNVDLGLITANLRLKLLTHAFIPCARTHGQERMPNHERFINVTLVN